MRLRRAETRTTWDVVVDTFDEASCFHTWDWLDFQERALGVPFDRYLVELDGEPVGVVPAMRCAPATLYTPLLPNPFQGPLVPPELARAVAAALRRRQLRRGLVVDRYEIGPPFADAWRAALRGTRLHPIEVATVVVDLVGFPDGDALRASYSGSHRRSLARAEREGCVIRRPRPGEVTRILPEVLSEAYGNHGDESPYPPEIGRQTEDWSRGREDVMTLVAEVGGEPAGVLVLLDGGPTALLWVAGCLRRFRSVRANFLLHHEGMVMLMERGYERMDFLAGAADPGVREFKMGFGGELTSGLRVESSLVPRGAIAAVRSLRGA
jgi:hypothetical protein